MYSDLVKASKHPARLTDEELQALRRDAVSEDNEALTEACDDAAFAGDTDAMERCVLAVLMRNLQSNTPAPMHSDASQ